MRLKSSTATRAGSTRGNSIGWGSGLSNLTCSLRRAARPGGGALRKASFVISVICAPARGRGPRPARRGAAGAAAGGRRTRRWPAAFAPRFYVGLIVGLVWLGPAWWNPRFAYAMVAWDVLLLVAWLADFRRLPRPAEIEVSRTWLGAVSLNVETAVTVELRNFSDTPCHAILYDDVPRALRPEPPQMELDAPRFLSARGRYSVRPIERGDITTGPVFLRLQSPMKLAERWAAANLDQTIRVYPNLQEPNQHAL